PLSAIFPTMLRLPALSPTPCELRKFHRLTNHAPAVRLRHWMLGVGCWMLDVVPALPRCVNRLPLVLLLASGLPSPAAVPATPGYNRDLRPILSNNCFYCHGPDEKKREAKLRLDVRDDALAEHDSGRAIVPGKPGESELLTRILSHDKNEIMPPP